MGYVRKINHAWADIERGIWIYLPDDLNQAYVLKGDKGRLLTQTRSIMAFYRLGEHICEYGFRPYAHRDACVAFRSLLNAMDNLHLDPSNTDWTQ